MARDWYDDMRSPATRAAIVAAELQRSVLVNGAAAPAGISSMALEPSIFGRDTPGYVAERDEFIAPAGGGSLRISPTFAKQIRYRPPAPPRDVGDASAMPGDDEGYEGMMR